MGKVQLQLLDMILDRYGLSVVLISVGVILLLIVSLFKNIRKRTKSKKKIRSKKQKQLWSTILSLTTSSESRLFHKYRTIRNIKA